MNYSQLQLFNNKNMIEYFAVRNKLLSQDILENDLFLNTHTEIKSLKLL